MQRHRPARALELGSFLGYSALRIARWLPPDAGLLVCLEADPACARVVRAVADFSGLGARVAVLTGLAADTLPAALAILSERAAAAAAGGGGGAQPTAGLVLLDHCKACYLPDLRAAEALGMVGLGSVVVADNVVYPGEGG